MVEIIILPQVSRTADGMHTTRVGAIYNQRKNETSTKKGVGWVDSVDGGQRLGEENRKNVPSFVWIGNFLVSQQSKTNNIGALFVCETH